MTNFFYYSDDLNAMRQELEMLKLNISSESW